MSTTSKVAMASAAGVLAATAVGLATTKKGRKFTRQVEQKITPMMRRRWNGIVSAVEASLSEHGVLQVIPARVREAVVQRLCMHESNGRSSASRSTRTSGSHVGRGRGGVARRRTTNYVTIPAA
jgi:hypothetical protein